MGIKLSRCETMDRSKKTYSLLKITGILFGIQALRIIINQFIFPFVDKTILNSEIITLSEMLLFTVLILLVCKVLNINLSIFPNNPSKGRIIRYSAATIIVMLLIILTPVFNGGFSSDVIIPLVLSTLATPVFEELIFRGYVWNELKHCFENELSVYMISTLLFAVWHLGYFDSIWFRMTLSGHNTGFAFAMFMKVITGLCFGIIIGFVRYKLKNSYAAMLMHSFMNIFGR
jgi:membrane protease YdiL (CAAX protease family)